MNTVTLGLMTRDEADSRFLAAMNGQAQGAFIGFENEDLLWKTLTRKRWQLLRVLTGEGPLTIREVARRIGRDVKAVHGDITALLACGVLEKTDSGQVIFPYDELHVDFKLRAA
jgi:predicted transcriptional regulator